MNSGKQFSFNQAFMSKWPYNCMLYACFWNFLCVSYKDSFPLNPTTPLSRLLLIWYVIGRVFALIVNGPHFRQEIRVAICNFKMNMAGSKWAPVNHQKCLNFQQCPNRWGQCGDNSQLCSEMSTLNCIVGEKDNRDVVKFNHLTSKNH
jgi:hypothetical protein